MAVIGSFANKTFSVSSNHMYTIDEISFNSELKFDEQEVDGSKPSTYIKGAGLDKVGFNLTLKKQKNVNVKNEIDEWIKIKNAKTPYMLILGNRNVTGNKFLLTNVDTTELILGPSGDYLKAKLQLQFLEYIRAGKKEDKEGKESGSNSSSKSKKTSETSKESKKKKKRKNKNAKEASKPSSADNAKVSALEKELYG